ncbi:B12-binding domain-containing radical SAM protein [Chloroflexota bacterium]
MTSLTPSEKSTFTPEVALVYPPLVDANFGSYYPSTAVLAGYLAAKGIDSIQTDLNEDFAAYILKPESLKSMADGVFAKNLTLSKSSMPTVAARLLIRYGHLLINEQGEHLFREDVSDLAYLLGILAEPYRIDVPLSDIAKKEFYDQPEAGVYRTFFESSGYAEALPASVNTVGISISVGLQLVPALILARHLKALRKDLVIILGGPVVSLMAVDDIEKILACNATVDVIVRSEGEKPLEALLKQRRAGSWDPGSVTGVSCHKGADIIHRPPGAGLVLDSIPYAEYDAQLMSRLNKPDIGIVQSRGCYWGKCAYCDYIELYKGNPEFRTRKADNFLDEMEYQIEKHGVHQFSVITEAIAPNSANKISQLILQRGLQVKWHSFALIDRRFTKEIFENLVCSGCDYLVIGVETMTDRILRLMGKAATMEEAIRFIIDAKDSGLDLKVNLIPNLPSITYEEAMDSLAVFSDLGECFIYVSSFNFEATRSSLVGRHPERFGLSTIDSDYASGQAHFSLNHLEVLDPAMNADEKERVIANYNAFAAKINKKLITDDPSSVIQKDSIDAIRFRLAGELLDFIQVEGGVQCYNWLTRKRFQMPEEWPALIDKMSSSEPFHRVDFIDWFPSASSGEFYFYKLLEKGILALFEEPNGDGAGGG